MPIEWLYTMKMIVPNTSSARMLLSVLVAVLKVVCWSLLLMKNGYFAKSLAENIIKDIKIDDVVV